MGASQDRGVDARCAVKDVWSNRIVGYSIDDRMTSASACIEVDIDAELAQLGPTGYRPLRVRDTLF